MSDPDETCPCGAPDPYDDCCGRFHRGLSKPATAEALMRSRYSAYVVGAIDYLVLTTYPAMRRTDLRNAYESTHKTITWIGLEVLETWQGSAADKTGKVEFKATYIQDGERGIHHERSRFRRHRGDWCYLDGQISE